MARSLRSVSRSGTVAGPDEETMKSIFRTMALIAACDDALRSAISAGTITLAYYSPRGQEAVAAGFAAALGPDDYLVTTYRGLHDHIAKGVPLRPLLAEMLGRAEGTGKGKGGPMHVVWPDAGLLLTTGVVGSGLPIACGLAWAAQRHGDGRVALVSFGDGATNIGAFHEACTLQIAGRLVDLLAPVWLRIGAYFYPRGGMPIDVFWQTGAPPAGVWVPDQGVPPYRGRG